MRESVHFCFLTSKFTFLGKIFDFANKKDIFTEKRNIEKFRLGYFRLYFNIIDKIKYEPFCNCHQQEGIGHKRKKKYNFYTY